MEEMLKQIMVELKAIKSTQEGMAGTLREHTLLLNALEDNAKVTRADIKRLEERMNGVEGEQKAIRKELSGLKEELQGVKNDLQGVKEELQGVKAEIKEVKENLCSLNKKVDEQNSYIIEKIGRHDMDIHILTKRVQRFEVHY